MPGGTDTRKEAAPSVAAMQRPAPPEATAEIGNSSAPGELPAEIAARIAALMNSGQEEKERRGKILRQYGIVAPALVLVAAILVVAGTLLRLLGR